MANRNKCSCGRLAHIYVNGEYFCKSCTPTKQTAAKQVETMNDIHVKMKPKKIIPVEIRKLDPECTCEMPKKKGLWARLLEWIAKGGPPDKCC